MSENESYKVGYGKPPKETQWKKGQSGNPKGRPKKTKDLEKLFDQELSQNIRIHENGETRTLTKLEAIVKGTVLDALKGNPKARKIILDVSKGQLSVDAFEADASDQKALQTFLENALNGKGEPEESTDD